MIPALFRALTLEEEKNFRQWARHHDTPDWRAKAEILHPVVRNEWERMDVAKRLAAILA